MSEEHSDLRDAARPVDDQIELAVAVEVPGHQALHLSPGIEGQARREGAIALAKPKLQHGRCAGGAGEVGDHVDVAVAVEVSDGHGAVRSPRIHRKRRAKSPSTGGQKDHETVGGARVEGVGVDQVGLAVPRCCR